MTEERARDRLGRPLPRDADPADAVPGVPVNDHLSAEQAWSQALDYLDRGMPFHAHEVFEMRWRQAPTDERAAWQALAQWGAALTHEARGNDIGARRVAARAQSLLVSASVVPACIDVDSVVASCRRLASS
jgi:uncharacterized protein